MSLQIQLQKCASVFCDNTLKHLPRGRRTSDRFCYACLSRTQLLSWKCVRCDNIISSHNMQKIYCSRACRDLEKNLKRRQYHREYYQRRKLLRIIPRFCKRCDGRIKKPHKKMYCGPYCYWLNYLKNRNGKIRKQLELFK